MTNPYFNASGYPGYRASGSSAAARGQFGAIAQGFDAVSAHIAALQSAAAALPALTAKVGRSKSLVDDFGFVPSGADGSAAANNAAMAAWIAFATANPGWTYTAKPWQVFRLTGTGFVLPNNMAVYTEGARFLWSGDISGSAGNIITLGQNTIGDIIRVHVKAGSAWRRLVTIQGGVDAGSEFDTVEIVSEEFGGAIVNNFDCSLRTAGSNIKARTLRVHNSAAPIHIRGTPGSATPDTNIEIGSMDVYNFIKGPIVNNVAGSRFLGGWVRGKGPGAVPSPGYNSLLIGSARTTIFKGFVLEDAGEHGLRLGGSASGEQSNRDLKFANILIRNPGQCGFKSFTGVDDPAVYQENITLSDITVQNPRARSGAGAWNDIGFLLQQMRNSRADGLHCFVDAGNPLYGMFISQSDNFHVNGYDFQQTGGAPATRALVISEANGPTELFPEAPRYDINNVSVTAMRCNGHSGEGVYIDIPTMDARMIHVEALTFGGTWGARWGGAATRAKQPCLFEIGAGSASSGTFNAPGASLIVLKNRFV